MSEPSLPFQEFERQGWESQALTATYHDRFSPLTRQTVDPLLDAASVQPGIRVLDVATGAGYVAASAAERGADVVGLDFSGTQMALARRTYPGIAFCQGDAGHLPFSQASFDAVVSSFGMPHFPDPDLFLRETFRVLRSGGRIAFSAWTSPQEAVGFGILLSAIRDHGSLDAPVPSGPDFFLFADPAQGEHSLRAAGFLSPHVTKVAQIWRLPSPDALLEYFMNGSVRMSALLRAQRPEAAKRIHAAVTASAQRFAQNGMIELPMPAVIAAAAKP